MTQPRYRTVRDLPETLTVFPLPGALLFPRWDLPLNIFEPRYLNMVDDAMHADRLIGMIQSVGGLPSKPDLAGTGCAGRITSWTETGDGRYLISLKGIARFDVQEECPVTTPYRQVRADWAPYKDDLSDVKTDNLPDRSRLIDVLKTYAETNEMQTDWNAVRKAPIETLVNALCSGCPFSVMEKQALVEAPTLKDRTETLMTLLEMDVSGSDDTTLQ